MAALTAERNARMEAGGTARTRRGPVEEATVIYHGALVAKNAAGFLVPASDTAGLKVLGVAQGTADNSAGADGDVECTYITGVTYELNNAGGAIVQASDKALCYAADDQSVSTAAAMTNDIVVGQVTEFTTTKVFVYIDERANA